MSGEVGIDTWAPSERNQPVGTRVVPSHEVWHLVFDIDI